MTRDASDRIPWFGPQVGPRELAMLTEVIESNYINDGEVTRRFEAEVARYAGTQFAVGVTSGTVAISLALMGLGVGHGDEVIVPDLTFAATANAVTMTGAVPVLVDIEPVRFGLDPDALIPALTSRTKAIVTVDVNGRAADYEQLEAIARARGLYLVTDSAEGFGSCFRGRPLGSIGDAGCFSFSANKTVTTGQGGMVTTNDPALAARLRELKDQGRQAPGTGGNDLHPRLGFNFKLTNLQAAVGLAQIEQLEQRLAFAAKRDSWYREALDDCAGITLPAVDTSTGEVTQWTDALTTHRDAVIEALDRAGINSRAFWLPLHAHAPYAQSAANFPQATRVSAQGLWLPSAYSLDLEDINRTCEVIRQTLAGL